jgi:diguanylate cyclase (GGDEF)-like protein
VISIKKFLTQNADENQTLMHVVRVLIDGVGQHAMTGEVGDGALFRETVMKVSDALVDTLSTAEILELAGSVLKALEDHNDRITKHRRLQTLELHNMVKMLTSAVGAVSAASNANIHILGEIENQLAIVSELDDVLIMKAKLSDCLTDIRKEAARQLIEGGEIAEQLGQGLDQARKLATSMAEGKPKDPITGLPLRPEAEAELAKPARTGSEAKLAVMVVDRLWALNQRFGSEVGDEVLAAFVLMVQQHLKPGDLFFRWGGPVFLALLSRPSSVERVRAEFGRVMETKLEHTIETRSRSIMVPISARWTVLPMMAAPRLLYQKIDAFAAPPSRE